MKQVSQLVCLFMVYFTLNDVENSAFFWQSWFHCNSGTITPAIIFTNATTEQFPMMMRLKKVVFGMKCSRESLWFWRPTFPVFSARYRAVKYKHAKITPVGLLRMGRRVKLFDFSRDRTLAERWLYLCRRADLTTSIATYKFTDSDGMDVLRLLYSQLLHSWQADKDCC